MSLINDALKRASQSDRNRRRPAETNAPMRPASGPPASSLSPAWVAGVVLAVALAGWCSWQWWNASRLPAHASVQPVASVAPKLAPAPILREAVPPPAPAAPRQAAAPPLTPALTPTPAPAQAPVVAAVPPAKPDPDAWPAELKVRGIFFSKTDPRALINGKTVGVGDQIDGIRVIKIESDRVSVQWKGRVKQLLME